MAEKLATLSFSDGTPSVDFPMLGGSVGPDVIDIRPLYAKTGKFTYDPGFMSTASCRSAITYIDGDAGILRYRGYPIEVLAEKCDFVEVLLKSILMKSNLFIRLLQKELLFLPQKSPITNTLLSKPIEFSKLI